MFTINVNGTAALTVSAVTEQTVGMASCVFQMMNPGVPITDLELA